jgi:hypothetical protein
MPYRIFTDSTGSEWQVWDVVPLMTERREGGEAGGMERRVRVMPIDFADRRRDARRTTQVRRALLRGTYSQGWLCFDNGRQKRRLTPIPGDWTTCSDELIETYMRHAERATGVYAAITEEQVPFAETG